MNLQTKLLEIGISSAKGPVFANEAARRWRKPREGGSLRTPSQAVIPDFPPPTSQVIVPVPVPTPHPRQATVPVPLRVQGRSSHPSHSSPKAGGGFQFHSGPKAGGRRRRGGYPQQPPAAAAGYRQPPGLLRRAAVPVGPCAKLLCKQPATKATAALAAKPESQPPSSRCHYPRHASALPQSSQHHYWKAKTNTIVRKNRYLLCMLFQNGTFCLGNKSLTISY